MRTAAPPISETKAPGSGIEVKLEIENDPSAEGRFAALALPEVAGK